LQHGKIFYESVSKRNDEESMSDQKFFL